MKKITKITKIENEKENTMKKIAKTNIITMKKKFNSANRKRNRKNEISTNKKCKIIEEN